MLAAERFASRAALGAIERYQRWISPYKGFRCAYAVAHGGPGCSGFARERIARAGLWVALADIRQRFAACRAAALALSAQRESDSGRSGENGKSGGGACNVSNGACASLSGCADCSGGPIACSCWP